MTDEIPFYTSEKMTWDDLGHGAPTIIALARACSAAALAESVAPLALSTEMKAILLAARQRGTMELKASNTAFNAVERMLAVYVEQSPHRAIEFRYLDDPRLTMRFLHAFAALCRTGFVAHHLFADFSLTPAGFEIADGIDDTQAQQLVDLARVVG